MTGIYFSGTGNTKYCVTRFLERLGADGGAYFIKDKSRLSEITEDREIVLAYPVYYSGIPKLVRDFIENSRAAWQGKRVFIIATMGLFSGDGAGVSARLLRKYGAEIVGGLHLKMPDCIGDVKALKRPPEKNRELIAKASEKIDRAAERFKNGKPTRDGLSVFHHLAGLFGQRLYFSGKTKEYTQNPKIDAQKCVGCGVCEGFCPMNNIRTENGKAVSGNRCTMCYRCFSSCPKKAITIIGKKVIEQYKFGNYGGGPFAFKIKEGEIR